jgi:hypothetical protein
MKNISTNCALRVGYFNSAALANATKRLQSLKLGTSHRFAERSIEREVISWATELASKRMTFQVESQQPLRIAA